MRIERSAWLMPYGEWHRVMKRSKFIFDSGATLSVSTVWYKGGVKMYMLRYTELQAGVQTGTVAATDLKVAMAKLRKDIAVRKNPKIREIEARLSEDNLKSTGEIFDEMAGFDNSVWSDIYKRIKP